MGVFSYFKDSLQPKRLRYTLIVRNITSYVIPNAPDGWDKTVIKWARNTEYFGLTRSLTLPYEFILDAAKILKKEFYTYGIEAKVQLQIEKLNQLDRSYDTILLGDIDFSQFNDKVIKVTANVMEGGLASKVKAYENVKYEFDLDTIPQTINLLIPPLQLIESTDLLIAPQLGDLKADYFPGLTIISNEIKSVGEPSTRERDANQYSNPDWTNADTWFFQAKSNGLVTMRVQLEGSAARFSGAPTADYRIDLVKNNDGSTLRRFVDIHIPFTDPAGVGVPFFVDDTFTFAVAIGDRYSFYLDISVDPNGSGFNFNAGTISLTYPTQSPATPCKALRARDLFQLLMDKMNGSPVTTQSDLLRIEWEGLTVTCGDALRQLSGAKIKTSFNDFWQSINSELNAEFEIKNGVAILEAKGRAFQNVQILDVGTVKDFELDPYETFIYNSVKVGYENQDYDEVNGREDVMSTQEYTFPITRIQKTLNLISPYRADPYGVEFTRINLSGKDTTDANSDNDTWFLKSKTVLNDDGQYQLEINENYTSVTGILSAGTYYNLDLTPKKMLYRHGNFLKSIVYPKDNGKILFASALKNVELSTADNFGNVVSEKSDVDIAMLDSRLFIPYVVTFSCAFERNVLQLLDTSPNGYIKFSHKNHTYKGFILEVSTDVAKNSERELKLLLTPDNNLLNLTK